jgi:lysophospholipase L1-like esterase
MHLFLPGSGHAVRRLRAALTTLVATLLVSAAVVIAGSGPAHAAGESYVALGDSYSSGVGTRSYIDDGTSCQRSTLAYPSLLAAQRGYALDFRACSGARVSDVANTQLGALNGGTSFVTISVGGNDAGFADVLTECALPGWASDCNGAIDGAQSYINNSLPASLDGLYGSIRALAPSAEVVVVGYPRIFMGEDCNALTWFSPSEETRLNQTADLITSRLAAVASAHGFGFANPTSAFIGHAVCDDPEWLNGLSNPVSDSYHPNQAGHASGYAPVVGGVLGFAFAASPAVLRAARAQGPELAAAERPYAALDRTVEPEQFRAPDLHSPAVKRAARAHGIDLDHWIAQHS